ncbi:YncE family protein [Saccharicrinis aurantiacus]|uniref:YncE family protein n=1 Tax=Saccharicrinis aurantiacus TaxID=1849719 RepID=UPI00094F926B|nr:hypothetical protein [Saccharicrinis aurantiacus]
MKNFFPSILLVFCVISVSCSINNSNYGKETSIVGTFVMNQGSGSANGSVTHYHADTLTNELFNEINDRPLTGEMLAASFGSEKGYFLMSEGNSSVIEKVNLDDFKSEMTSASVANATDVVCVSDTFVYATIAGADEMTSGELLKIDATTLSIKETIKVGINPTKIAYDKGKLVYVANTSDLENGIMIVDLVRNQTIDTVKIETLVNPVDMVIDVHSNLWVLCEGEGESPKSNAGLVRISYTANDEGERDVTNLPFDGGYYGKGRRGISTSLGGGTVYYINKGAYSFNVNDFDKLDADNDYGLNFKKVFGQDYADVVFDAVDVSSRNGMFYSTLSEESKVIVFDSFGIMEEEIEVGTKPRNCLFR